MHWTRIGIVATAVVALVGTCLPWLTHVPPKVLTIGDGTIYGITTVHGIIAAVCAAGAVALALLWGTRRYRMPRVGSAALILLGVAAISIGSLVIGTDQAEVLDEAEKQTLAATGDQHQANLAVIAMAKILDKYPMKEGYGAYPFALGWAALALLAVVALFLRGEPRAAS